LKKVNNERQTKPKQKGSKMETITVNGIEYVKKEDIPVMAETLDGLPYVICRTYSAGVFAGYLKSKNGKEVALLKARRIWHWQGAASLSQLAVDGTSKPEGCKFPCEVAEVMLTEAIEIIETTEKARLSIQGVPEWKS